MPEGIRRPSSYIARVEDEDPETGEAVYGTAVEASRSARANSSTVKLQHLSARQREPGPASDSGYSSLVNSSLANEELAMAESTTTKAPAPPVQRPAGVSPSKSSSKPRTDNPAATVAEDSRDTERRFTLPDRERRTSSARPSYPPQSHYSAPSNLTAQIPQPGPPLPPLPQLHQPPPPSQPRQQYPTQYPTYQSQPYQQPYPQPYPPQPYPQPYSQPQPYPQPHAGSMAPPPVPLSAGPRRRLSSNTSRPLSMHTYGSSYDGSIRGPPPSSSAYISGPQYSPIGPSQPHGEYFGSSQPHRVPVNLPPYTPPSPMSPTQPTMYSARLSKPPPNFGGMLEPQRVASVPPVPIGRSSSFSARRGSVALADPRLTRQIADRDASPSSEDSDSSDDDNRYPSNAAMLHPSRRQYYEKQSSAQGVPRSIMRDPRHGDPRRMSRSDTGVEYQDQDSDRSSRAILQGSQPSSSRGPRRPSITTANSSSRRQQIVGTDDSGYCWVKFRNDDGTPREEKMPKAAAKALLRQMGQELMEDDFGKLHIHDKLEAQERNAQRYQTVNGTAPNELTAETLAQIKQQTEQPNQQGQQQQLNRRSGSHVSGRTHHSRRSGSITQHGMGSDYVTIKDAETGLPMAHVAPGQTIEVMRVEGSGMRTVITSTSGQESGYHGGSRSSRSGGHRRSYYGSSDYNTSRRPTYDEIDYDSSGYERAI